MTALLVVNQAQLHQVRRAQIVIALQAINQVVKSPIHHTICMHQS